MEYGDFYDISVYGNEMWKGSFTPKETACNAEDYWSEFQWSKENGTPTHTIKELAKLLAEDGSEECHDWLYDMAWDLGLLDMDFRDYEETDSSLVARFLADN